MARYRADIVSPQPIEQVFDLFARFERISEWDPGVTRARRLTAGEPGQGTEYEVVVSTLGVKTPLIYRVIAFDPPRRIVLEAQNKHIRSLDTVTCRARSDGGTDLVYDALLELKGPRKIFEASMKVSFQVIGRKAEDGLRRAVGASPR
ncbi:MAG: SRPBCC family protein [Bradymonadia bacterium]